MAEVRDPRRWAQRAWPTYDWAPATVVSGAFHKVVICAPAVVARLAVGRDHRRRVARELATARVVCDLGLPYALPRPLGEAVSSRHGTGMLTTFVRGTIRADVPWRTARQPFAELLHTLREISAGPCRALSPPRAWCGGQRWPDIVTDELMRRLPAFARDRADRVIADLIAVEHDADDAFVHGDLGLHNALWTRHRITGLIDADHACWGDSAIDVAPLIGVFGAAAVAEIAGEDLAERGMYHRATLPLQVAAAAELVGDHALRDHALGNFTRRVTARTLYDPQGSRTLD